MNIEKHTPEYARHYRAGRAAFNRGTSITAKDYAPPAEFDAWMDGFLDMNADRDMWHLRDCVAHHNAPGGCGQA